MSTTAWEEEEERPNRVWMPGMIWNANHVLHLALKQETQTIPSRYFCDAKGILLLNIVEVGLLFSGSYGTGVLLAKNDKGKWSLPCSMGFKSVGVGSLGTAVKDLIVFIFDDQTLQNLASTHNGLHMEHKGRATLGPLGRHETHRPQVSSKAITDVQNYAAYSFTKGAFVGITGDFASVGPYQDVNEAFYKNKDITPQDILFGSSVNIPSKNADTLLPDVYKKLDMLSKGVKYDGTEKSKSTAESEQAPRLSVTRKSSTSSTKSSSSPSQHSSEKCPSVTKQASSSKPKPRHGVLKSAANKSNGGAKPHPSVTKSASEKHPSVTKTASAKATNKPATSSRTPSNKTIKSVRPSATKKFLTTTGSVPSTQEPRPSVIKKASVKVKPAAERRTSIEIKGYNC